MIDFDTLLSLISNLATIVLDFASREHIKPFVPAFSCGLLFWVAAGIDRFIVKLSGRVLGWALLPPFIASLCWAFFQMPEQPELLEKYGFWGDQAGRLMQSILGGALVGGAAMYVPFLMGGFAILLYLVMRHPLKTIDVLIEVFSSRRCHCH